MLASGSLTVPGSSPLNALVVNKLKILSGLSSAQINFVGRSIPSSLQPWLNWSVRRRNRSIVTRQLMIVELMG